MNLLLWNTQRKNLTPEVTRLLEQHCIDVAVLVEWYEGNWTIANRIPTLAGLHRVESSERFGVFVRPETRVLAVESPGIDGNRVCMWTLCPPNVPIDLHLVAVHGHGRLNSSVAKREYFFERLRESIELVERRTGHAHTIVVGDFNDNPFDPSIASVRGLHALPVEGVGGKSFRVVQRQPHEFFYNPMWKCYGRDNAPIATYYYNGSDIHELFWHMIDQVVVRPSLLPYLSRDPVRILARSECDSLHRPGGIRSLQDSSDHFPVIFSLDFAEHS